jgi:thiol:disulfide interchange protein DsbC
LRWDVKAIPPAETSAAELAEMGIDISKAIVIGTGPNYVVEFSDPDCPYCRKGSRYLDNRNDVTRYIFLSCAVHSSACSKISYILTVSDPAVAYLNAMTGKMDNVIVSIPTPEGGRLREEHQNIIGKNKVTGFPTYIVNGKRIIGYDPKGIENALEAK